MLAALAARLFSSPSLQAAAYAAYAQTVTAARAPVFYTDCGLPDTLDGRFQAIVLHLFLLLGRLRAEKGAEAEAFSRFVAEAFFEDMDRSLRELGVTDTGVGKRVRKMARAFYGHVQAYQASAPGTEDFRAALLRNAYGTVQPRAEEVERLVRYLRQAEDALCTLPQGFYTDAALLSGAYATASTAITSGT
jgi:cytochrome b pre-mRNA-processing protein 3